MNALYRIRKTTLFDENAGWNVKVIWKTKVESRNFNYQLIIFLRFEPVNKTNPKCVWIFGSEITLRFCGSFRFSLNFYCFSHSPTMADDVPRIVRDHEVRSKLVKLLYRFMCHEYVETMKNVVVIDDFFCNFIFFLPDSCNETTCFTGYDQRPMLQHLTPVFRNIFTDMFQTPFDYQDDHICGRIELNMMKCLEAYGGNRGFKECRDYIDDFVECTSFIKSVIIQWSNFFTTFT